VIAIARAELRAGRWLSPGSIFMVSVS